MENEDDSSNSQRISKILFLYLVKCVNDIIDEIFFLYAFLFVLNGT